jgi:hypothetical protein
MNQHEVDQHTPHQAMSISQPRAHPLRMLVVFAFATTGLLHLVAWPSGSEIEIYATKRGERCRSLAVRCVCHLTPQCSSSRSR